MTYGQSHEMGVGGSGCAGAPQRPWPGRGLIVGQERVFPAKSSKHSFQRFGNLFNGEQSSSALKRDPDEAQFRNRRGCQRRSPFRFRRGNPSRRPGMIHMIGPSPSDQNVDIEQVFHHGKSDSISRTFPVVSGFWPDGAKIIAPVYSQRTLCGGSEDCGSALAWRRRYSDRLVRCFFARERISRASSSLTLNEMVCIWYYGNTKARLSKNLIALPVLHFLPNPCYNHHPRRERPDVEPNHHRNRRRPDHPA